jgi:hypothetical protein
LFWVAIRSRFAKDAQLVGCLFLINRTEGEVVSALDQVTRSELICGETDSVEVGDCVEITVLEIDGDNVVLQIDGVEESKVVIVGGLAAS